MNDYQKEYEEILNQYKAGTIGPEKIGALVAKFGAYFSVVNLAYGSALKAYNLKEGELIESIEENGKPITSQKAKTLAVASNEGLVFIDAKINKEIIEKQIDTLGVWQRGVASEFVKGGNM